MIGGKKASYYLIIITLVGIALFDWLLQRIEQRLLRAVDMRMDEENTRQLELMREAFQKDVLDARLQIIRNDRSAAGGNISEKRHHAHSVPSGMAGTGDSGEGYRYLETD